MIQSTTLLYVNLQAELNDRHQTEDNKLFFILKHLSSLELWNTKSWKHCLDGKVLVLIVENRFRLRKRKQIGRLPVTFDETNFHWPLSW